MASLQRIFVLSGGSAAVLLAAASAQAEELATEATTKVDATAAIAAVEANETATTFAAVDLAPKSAVKNESVAIAATPVLFEAKGEPEAAAEWTLSDFLSESQTVSLEAPETPRLDQTAAVRAESPATASFSEPRTTELEATDTSEAMTDGQELAQVTRPLYRGVSPFYVGVGGNIGIIDSDNSAVGDFGFNVFSKISLGPRFAVRPMFQVSEDDLNVTLPVTFNFNPIDVGRFNVYPSLGGGVDFGDDIGLLINGGLDIPISRNFTLNGQVNWRVTEDTGLGVSLGVGYNFPLFFE